MKCLRVVIDGEEYPNYTITKAFERAFEYVETVWIHRYYNDRAELNRIVREKLLGGKFDVVFMQIQEGEIIFPQTFEGIYDKIPIFNWTGDVRHDVDFFVPLGKETITLFSNNDDVKIMRDMSFRSDYFQVGYDHTYYSNLHLHRLNTIVFIGNNYSHDYFAQSAFRRKVVESLIITYPENVRIHGYNWEYLNMGIKPTPDKATENKIYNESLLALNIPHINRSRYYSDRQLRAMACGCLVLTQNYEELDYEFTDGENILVWNTIDELLEKTWNCFIERDRSLQMGLNSEKFVKEKCNWDYRLNEFMQLIKKYQ